MAARGRRFSAADSGEAGLIGGHSARSPRRLRFGRGAAVVVGLLVLWPWIAPYSVLGDSLLALEFALVAISLVLLIGWVGQISLAQASFVGIGALFTAMVSRGWGLGFPANLLVGAAMAGVAAVLLGLVALRVRGLYLAVATLIFAWMADQFLFRSPWLGMGTGSSTLPNQRLGVPGGFPYFDLTSRRVLYFVMVAVVVVVVAALSNLRDTKVGRAFFAIRGSELAAASLGVDVVRYKLMAFAVAGVVAGVGGGLIMLEQRTVVPDQFLFTVSLQYLAIAVVGGLTSVGGALGAGAVFASLNELFFRVRALSGWLEVVSAGLLVAVLLSYPGGLAALSERLAPWWRRLGALARRVIPPDRFSRMANEAAAAALGHGALPAPSGNGNGGPVAQERLESSVPVAVETELPEVRAERHPLLEAEGVTVRFGGLTAVRDASLSVREGEIVGLIGPNGAGKTTFFNAMLGLVTPDAGTVRIHGEDVTQLAPHHRAKLGVARTFQVIQLFNDLTVFDNLLVATHLRNRSGLFSNIAASAGTLGAEREARARVEHVLERLGLADVSGHA